jgi:radical SAM superfamily enzyme with C-terminal helix-hairpin-helix motif
VDAHSAVNLVKDYQSSAPIKDIISEVEALYRNSVRHFRLGSQPCLFSYMAKDTGKEEYPKPDPEAIERLFKGIRSIAPDLLTLHIDNVNPWCSIQI